MHNNVTSVALYDTLGIDASRYIIDQTELTTMACSSDLVQKVCNLKKDDPDGKCARLVNIISFGDAAPKEALDLA